MARLDNCDLNENHWEVINFLREYYDEYQIAPAVRVLTKAIGKKLGPDKGNSKYLYELFPYGPGQAGVQDRRPAEAHRLRLSGPGRAGTRSERLSRADDRSTRCSSTARAAMLVVGVARKRIRELCAHARAAEDPDHAGADHAPAAWCCACCAR